MPSGAKLVKVEPYVIDVLMRDIVGHDQQPAAFLVYLFLYGQAAGQRWRPIAAGLGTIAETTGLSRSAVQAAMIRLRQRKLISTQRNHATATPKHRVLRPWRG